MGQERQKEDRKDTKKTGKTERSKTSRTEETVFIYVAIKLQKVGDYLHVVIQTTVGLDHLTDDVPQSGREYQQGYLMFVQLIEKQLAAISRENKK